LPQIAADVETLERAFKELYSAASDRRNAAYGELVSVLSGRPEWSELPAAAREDILGPIKRHCSDSDDSPAQALRLNPSIEQMENRPLSCRAPSLGCRSKDESLLIPPDQPHRIERVKVRDFFRSSISSEKEFDDSVQSLREYCMKLIAEGSRVIFE